jgi:hypothetical protein
MIVQTARNDDVDVAGDRRRQLAGVRCTDARPARRGRPAGTPGRGTRHRRGRTRRPPGDYPGMGHNLPRELWPAMIDEIRQLTR